MFSQIHEIDKIERDLRKAEADARRAYRITGDPFAAEAMKHIVKVQMKFDRIADLLRQRLW
jgi:hypothetical protein